MCSNVKCVACTASLQQAPSRLQLSVRQPRRGCLRWGSKKHTVVTFYFKEALWQQGASCDYEQTAASGVKELARLRRLENDLPVKVKWWIKGRSSKLLMQISLCALLDQLEGTTASEGWLAFTVTGQDQRVWWHLAHHQLGADLPLSDDSQVEDLAESSMEYDDLWGSDSKENPLGEELAADTTTSCVTEGGKGADGEWVTFINPSTGKTLRLPPHNKEEVEERWRAPWACTSLDDLLSIDNLLGLWNTGKWRAPGAWTSEDDLLSVRALRIVANIKPVVKKPRFPEGPQWWENTGPATVTFPVEESKHQDADLLPPDWNMPAFPLLSAETGRPDGADAGLPEASLPAPHQRGGAVAGLPEVTLPAPEGRSEAVRESTRRRRRRPLLTIVVALVYMMFIPWVVNHGDNFLDAISARVYGWVNMWLSGWVDRVASVGE